MTLEAPTWPTKWEKDQTSWSILHDPKTKSIRKILKKAQNKANWESRRNREDDTTTFSSCHGFHNESPNFTNHNLCFYVGLCLSLQVQLARYHPDVTRLILWIVKPFQLCIKKNNHHYGREVRAHPGQSPFNLFISFCLRVPYWTWFLMGMRS